MIGKLIALLLAVVFAVPAFAEEAKPISQLREDFLKWKFGMFIHFNVATFNEREWANGYEDPATFEPDNLDCNQWAEAAASAGMEYAVLTVKHTGGWCLWDSKYTASHDMTAFANYKDGKGDLVRDFVDSFRAHGIGIGLYYCAPGDYNGRNGNPGLAEDQENLHGMPPEAKGDYVGFMKKQFTELLTQYGPIDLIWVDQYRRPYTRDHWPEIIQHGKSLQPDCLVIANNSQDFTSTDIFSYEYPWMMKRGRPERALPPEGNTDPGEVCDIMGPAWFWKSTENESTLKNAEEIVRMLRLCNDRRANYLLNVAPDRSGLIPAHSVKRLREVGDLLGARPTTPGGPQRIENEVEPL
jgi:alpha-L-fucosidase